MASQAQIIAVDVKRCTRCGETKPIDEFSRHARMPDGRQGWCKICLRAAWRQSYYRNPELQRTRHLRRRHGIDHETFESIRAMQGNRCAVCGDELGTGNAMHLDHCHDTKVIRGILCRHCNMALGQLGEDVERVRKLLRYLEHPPLNLPHNGERSDH